MALVGELVVMIAGNSAPLTAALAKSETEIKGFSASGGIGMAAIGMAGAAVAAGVAIIGVEASKSASEFAATMELIHTQAGASQAEVERMTKSVRDLSPAVGIGPKALADGLFHIESAGFRGAKALDVLRIAAEGAQVGHAKLESVTGALLGAVNSHVQGVHNSAQAMGVLNSIVGAGDMRMEELAGAMTTGILPAARTFGVSIQSVGAALADMSRQHIPAEEAATRLRMTLSLLGAPSAKAQDDLKSIGIGATQLAEDMRSGGILQAVQDLKHHLDESGLSATKQAALLSHAFGGGRSSSAILTLVGSVRELGSIQNQVTAGTKHFGEAWAATQEDVAQKGDQARAALEATVDALGSGFLPAIGSVLSAIQPMLAGIEQWVSANPQLAATILVVVGGIAALLAALAAIGTLFGVVAGAIAVVTSPIILIGVAIAALVVHFNLLGPIAAFLGHVFASLPSILNTVVSALSGAAGAVGAWVEKSGVLATISDAIGAGLAALPGILTATSSAIGTYVGIVQSAAAAAVAWVQENNVIPTVVGAISSGLSSLVSTISSVVSAIVAFVTNTNNQRAALGMVQSAIDGVRSVLGFLGQAIGVVVGWIGNFVSHLTGTTNSGRQASTAMQTFSGVISSVGHVLSTVAGIIGPVVSWLVQLAAAAIDNANKLGLFKAAGDLVYTVFGLLGNAVRNILGNFGQLAGMVGGGLTIAFNAIKIVIDGITAAINAAINAIKSMIDLAGKAVNAVASIPGVKLGGDVVGNIGGALGNLVPHAEGVWNVGQDHAALIHAGEMVVPAHIAAAMRGEGGIGGGFAAQAGSGGGHSGGPIHIHHTTNLQIDGHRIQEWLEEKLFNSASTFTSGFLGNPVTE